MVEIKLILVVNLYIGAAREAIGGSFQGIKAKICPNHQFVEEDLFISVKNIDVDGNWMVTLACVRRNTHYILCYQKIVQKEHLNAP
ncbi:hypothetical protein EAF00_007887 [Botryotinia globosa]|nr:hypothetical protein EAF00_007887 [Botryotinia globosa]